MLRVNIVVKPGWILERFARELLGLPWVRMNAMGYPPRGPSDDDATYFLPMKDIRHVPTARGIKIGYFTHGFERVHAYYDRFDACLAMNEQIGGLLRQLGARRVSVIRPGTEPPARPIVFGVCGRVYGKGRKGAFLVESAVDAGYVFRACSEPQRQPPPCPISHGIADRSAFYQSIDYLVVTSLDEGGPMPVVEAIAHGVPVIAPDVGWCWEFPVIRYAVGEWRSLEKVLYDLTHPPTWAAWTAANAALFRELEEDAR